MTSSRRPAAAALILCSLSVAALAMPPTRLYEDQITTPVGSDVRYGYDLGDGTLISSLTPEAYATVGDLIAASSWNFSGVTAPDIFASFTSLVAAPESCNADECGYISGARLSREDKTLFDPNGVPADTFIIHTVTENELRGGGTPTDLTIWLRAGTINEGRDPTSLFARDGESRICYTDEPGIDRSEVPLWRFANQDSLDPSRWYMEIGDAPWSSAVFDCQNNVFAQNCGTPNVPIPSSGQLYVAGPSGQDCANRSGTQHTTLIKSGPVTLPSGHILDAFVLRTVADFCVYSNSSCSGFLSRLDEVRTVNYLWQVPNLGTVVRLQSPQISSSGCAGGADPDLCFGELDETDIKFGLLPPLSLGVTAIRDTEVDLSWNPGLVTTHIDDYRIYWDTDSGSATPYAFDSDTHAGQVSFGGTTATISGLTPGTAYHFTVNSRSTNVNISSGAATTFESLSFPAQITGPATAYPAEISATTTGGACVPTALVNNLLADHAGTGNVEVCWDAGTDPCLEGYRLLHAATPEAAGNFTLLADTTATCWTGAAADGFFLTVATGGGGSGPTGHHP